MNHPSPPAATRLLGRTLQEWLSSLPIFVLLVLTLVIGTGEMMHGQLLKLGESMFGDQPKGVQYFMLRADPTPPTCNPNPDIEEEIRKETEAKQAQPADDLDALFGETKLDPEVLRKSKVAAAAVCKERHSLYNRIKEHITPKLKAYRMLETSFFGLFKLGTENRPLILLIMVGLAAITTTLGFHHIGIRPARYRKDFIVQNLAIAAASGLLLYSSIRYYQISKASGIEIEHPHIYFIWMGLFSILLAISLKRLVKLPGHIPVAGEGSWGHAALSIPLFASMAVIAGLYFLLHGHDSGLAIYVNQMMELPSLFLNLGLFIWAGMLLKQSRMVDLFMNIVRPWKLSPEALTYIILLAAAVPTAYTGASGIFVIAAGAIVFHEVRAVGGSRQFALAATAMSGSLGVVLRPCLLVVLITALNKQVTTNLLYHWGVYVFALTSTLFFVASQMHRTQRVKITPPSVALPQMLRQVVPVLPYVAVVLVIVALYEYVLDTKLNEITAPTIMPVMMLLVLIFDKVLSRKDKPVDVPEYAAHRQSGVESSIRFATTETIGHIGALLSLMMLSLAIGGVIERSEIMALAPKEFASPWTAMAFLLVVKVLLGMVMDPFGAVIVVSSTLAPIAYANGIDPVHFWMMVLVAFELGYLMPPVALNQLLMRQVVGEEEVERADKEVRHLGFYRRYERWILPTAVMSVGLVIVAFLPIAVQDFPVLQPVAKFFHYAPTE